MNTLRQLGVAALALGLALASCGQDGRKEAAGGAVAGDSIAQSGTEAADGAAGGEAAAMERYFRGFFEKYASYEGDNPDVAGPEGYTDEYVAQFTPHGIEVMRAINGSDYSLAEHIFKSSEVQESYLIDAMAPEADGWFTVTVTGYSPESAKQTYRVRIVDDGGTYKIDDVENTNFDAE